FAACRDPDGRTWVAPPPSELRKEPSPRPPLPPCGPNHTIPSGFTACRNPDGSTWVGPPPGVRKETSEGTPKGEPRSGRERPSEDGSDKSSIWLTAGGITAIAALLGAIAALIRAVRKNQ